MGTPLIVSHESDWIPPRTGPCLRLSHLTLYLLPPSWSQTSIVWQLSLPLLAHSHFPLIATAPPPPYKFFCISHLVLASASWRSKLHSNMERSDWKQVVRWRFGTGLSHPWWLKRISSWVAGGGHIVSDTRWWPRYQRFHCWWPGGASWWSWMPLQLRWFRILQGFRRYGEKDAYKDRLLLSWLTICKGVRN